MKKTLALCVTVSMAALLFASLAGCGASPTGAPTAAVEGSPSAAQTAAGTTAEPVSQPSNAVTESAAATVQAAAATPAAPTETAEPDFFEGIWEQQGANGSAGKYAFLFQDGKVWIGYAGDSAGDFLSGAHGLNSLAARPFRLEADRIIVTLENGATLEWKRSVDTFWIEGSGASAMPVEAAGEYLPGGE